MRIIHLVETILAAVADIDNLDHLGPQTWVEHVTLTELCLEIRTASQHKTADIDFVVGNEVLNCKFSNLANVVVPLLVSKTGETKGRLTTTAVLLGEIDGKLVDDLARITGESTEESSISVHHDESETGIGFKKLRQGFSVEFIVTKIKRPECERKTRMRELMSMQGHEVRTDIERNTRIDWFMGFKVEGNFLLLAFIGKNCAYKENQTVRGHTVVKLKTLLGTGDSSEHGEPVHTRLYVGSCTILLCKHSGCTGYLVLYYNSGNWVG